MLVGRAPEDWCDCAVRGYEYSIGLTTEWTILTMAVARAHNLGYLVRVQSVPPLRHWYHYGDHMSPLINTYLIEDPSSPFRKRYHSLMLRALN